LFATGIWWLLLFLSIAPVYGFPVPRAIAYYPAEHATAQAVATEPSKEGSTFSKKMHLVSKCKAESILKCFQLYLV
jgi:hypothetical protein